MLAKLSVNTGLAATISSFNAALTGMEKGASYTFLTVASGMTTDDAVGIVGDVASVVASGAAIASAAAATGAAGASLATAAAVAATIAALSSAYLAGRQIGQVIVLVQRCYAYHAQFCGKDAGPADGTPADGAPDAGPADMGADAPRDLGLPDAPPDGAPVDQSPGADQSPGDQGPDLLLDLGAVDAGCPPNYADCGEGFCTNLLSSYKHCGTCGNTCPSGVCTNGSCPSAGKCPVGCTITSYTDPENLSCTCPKVHSSCSCPTNVWWYRQGSPAAFFERYRCGGSNCGAQRHYTNGQLDVEEYLLVDGTKCGTTRIWITDSVGRYLAQERSHCGPSKLCGWYRTYCRDSSGVVRTEKEYYYVDDNVCGYNVYANCTSTVIKTTGGPYPWCTYSTPSANPSDCSKYLP